MTLRSVLRWIVLLLASLGGLLVGCNIEETPPSVSGESPGMVVIQAIANGYQLKGGTIFFDGEELIGALTPDTISSLAGNHLVKVVYPNWQSGDTVAIVTANATTLFPVTLQPAVPQPPLGTAQITAQDSVTQQALSAGIIFFNEAIISATTPTTLTDIPEGEFTIGVGLLGQAYRDTTVTIAQNAGVNVNLSLPQVAFNGIKICSGTTVAQVCIDDQLYPNLTPWLVTGVPEGRHSFSCYVEGYATNLPGLYDANLFSYGSQELTFTLEGPLTSSPYEGNLAPGFALQSDSLDTVALGGLRGRVVLVNFWYKDCPPCMAEIPDLQRTFEDFSPAGFRLLGINRMQYDNVEVIHQVREQFGITFKLLMDTEHLVQTQYYVAGYPLNVLIDKRGIINWRTIGITYEDLSARVQTLLNQ